MLKLRLLSLLDQILQDSLQEILMLRHLLRIELSVLNALLLISIHMLLLSYMTAINVTNRKIHFAAIVKEPSEEGCHLRRCLMLNLLNDSQVFLKLWQQTLECLEHYPTAKDAKGS